jgi:hypothetical protein
MASETGAEERPTEREDEGEELTRAEQGDRDRKCREEHHDEEQEEIEAELDDLQEMEGPDA